MPSAPVSALNWVELVLGFSCNCRCLVCHSWRATGPEMSVQQAVQSLRLGRSHGAKSLWLGGGEPTLYRALGKVLVEAHELGYQTIRLQTNGLRLAYREYADAVVARGVTHVAFSVFGSESSAHDLFVARPGAYELAMKALENCANAGVDLEVDLLVTTETMLHLPDMVRGLVARGVQRFWFWLVSVQGLGGSQFDYLVPALSSAAAQIAAACSVAIAHGAQAWSLHTPPCTLSATCRRYYRHAGHWKLLVVTPSGNPFMAEHSPMEGGVFLPSCDSCKARPACLGLRADYLALHGTDAINPIVGS